MRRRFSSVLEDGRRQQALNVWFGRLSALAASQWGSLQSPVWSLDDSYDVYVHHA